MNRRYDNKNNRNKPENKPKEEYVIVLDVLVDNNSSFNSNKKIQALGFNTYMLLELIIKPGVDVKVGQKLYVGDGKREEVQYIKRVLPFEQLTSSAASELTYVIEEIVEEKEEQFVKFFNMAGPISLRRHSFELIPGVGKKNLTSLIKEREKKPFESYKEINERCSFISDVEKAIVQRIENELKEETEHKFFIKIKF